MVLGLFKRKKGAAAPAAPVTAPDEESRMAGNYPYAVTRIRARKTTLITPDQFEKLVVYDVPQVTRFIQESQYRSQIDRLGVKFKGVDLLEQALALHLSELFTEILSFCEGPLLVMIRAYLHKYDAQNYKNILRGKATGTAATAIQETIIAAGPEDVDFWNKLTEVESFDAAIERIKAPYGDEVRAALKQFKRDHPQVSARDSLPIIEDTIDRILYAKLLTAAPGNSGAEQMFREFIARNIDISNLTTLFVLVGESLDSAEILKYMLPGGVSLKPELQQELAQQKGIDAFLDALKKSSYWQHIEAADPKVLESKSIAKLEAVLKRHVAKWCAGKGKQFPLSALPIIEFILRKELEVQSLRILARGKSLGLSEADLRDLLDLRK